MQVGNLVSKLNELMLQPLGLLSLWALNFVMQLSYVNPIARIETNDIRRARKVFLNQRESPSSNAKMSLLSSVKLRFWVWV